MSSPKPANPYRQILRREIPEPFIALLMFILGLWLWDHYFGEAPQYAPDTEEMALLQIDRDVRLAEAMQGDPAWMRWMAGVRSVGETISKATSALDGLIGERAVGERALQVRAILTAHLEGQPMAEVVDRWTGGNPPARSIPVVDATTPVWIIHWLESTNPPPGPWRAAFDESCRTLRFRALMAGGFVRGLAVLGLLSLPVLLPVIRQALRAQPRCYVTSWPLALGWTAFLIATLSWIGFMTALEIGLSALPDSGPWLTFALDSAARLFPPLVIIGMLFRRPAHAWRSLGMHRSFHPFSIAAVFGLLAVADPVLRKIIPPESSAVLLLSSADAGLAGLVATSLSACLIAPVAEEILYRGILFQSFANRLGALAGAVATSSVFAVLHFYDGYGLVSVALFGVASSILYAGTRSLAACIVLHILYNTSIKVPEWIVYHAPL